MNAPMHTRSRLRVKRKMCSWKKGAAAWWDSSARLHGWELARARIVMADYPKNGLPYFFTNCMFHCMRWTRFVDGKNGWTKMGESNGYFLYSVHCTTRRMMIRNQHRRPSVRSSSESTQMKDYITSNIPLVFNSSWSLNILAIQIW